MRLQYYWKLDKNIPHIAHHWGILFTSLTLTQGIKITLRRGVYDFTNPPPPTPPPRNLRSCLIKGTKLCSPFLPQQVTCRKRMPIFIQFLSGTGSNIYNWTFSAKSAVKIALEMAGYWPGSFWQTSWPPYWCTKE